MAHVVKGKEPLTEISDKIVEILAALHDIEAGTLDGLSSDDFVQITGAQIITGPKTFSNNLIIQDDGQGLLQFNNATYGGRAGRVFVGPAGDFILRPTTAPNVDANTRDFRFSVANDVWEFDGGLNIVGELSLTQDTFLQGSFNSPAVNNRVNAAMYSVINTRLEISTEDSHAMILNHKDTDENGTGTTQQFRYDGVVVGSINHDPTSTTYSTTSDARLKANERPLDTEIDLRALVLDPRMRPRRYERTDAGNREQDGFIAQDMMEVVPQAAMLGEGVPGTPEFVPAMVSLGNLTPYLWAICRKQQETIDDLVTANSALTARIAALERR